MSPDLGAWGDDYASTPNIDRLAAESVRYTAAFATAPVCSPSRSTLITGVYATSLGTQRLRSRFPIPPEIKGFPSYLRAAGYYTTNNVKTDYNTSDEARLIEESWDETQRDRPLAGPRRGTALLRRLQRHDHPPVALDVLELRGVPGAGPEPPVARGDPRSRRRAGAALLSRHPGRPEDPRPLLRLHHRHGQERRADPRRAGGGRPGRRHDRLLLLRPRGGPAPPQAGAAGLGDARAAAHPLPGEVPAPRARRPGRDGGPPGELRRLSPDRAEPPRSRHPRASWRAPPSSGRRRASPGSTSSAPGTGSTRPTTWPARSGTTSTSTSGPTCPTSPTTSPAPTRTPRTSARRSSAWPSGAGSRARSSPTPGRSGPGRSSTRCARTPNRSRTWSTRTRTRTP